MDEFYDKSGFVWGTLALAFLLAFALFRYHVLLLMICRSALRLRLETKPAKNFPRFTVLIPAHNEELGIAATLGSLHALDYPKNSYRIIVIADNCSDQTARAAKACGVEVFERFDDKRKSKGYALEYAIERLGKESIPPDAVVVIDADTRVDRGLLNAFAQRLHEGQDFLQGYYGVSNPDDSWRTELMTYAFALFNGIWLAGQDALGLGCSLRGNGMCFRWEGLKRQPWKAYGLAEDLEFSWHLRLSGEKIYFVPEAKVYGEIISGNAKASEAQRSRWEKGRAELKKTFADRIKTVPMKPFQKWLLATDLKMMPLSRWFVLTGLGTLLSFASLNLAISTPSFVAIIPSVLLLAFHFTMILIFLTYLSLPFTRLGLPGRYIFSLAKAPLYIIWKLRILLSRKPATWVRTERVAEQKAKSDH